MSSTHAPPLKPETRWEMLRRVMRLAVKELRETLRDRRTIITLLLMPLLVYPLLAVMFQRFMLASMHLSSVGVTYDIGVESTHDASVVDRFLHRADELARPGSGSPPRETPQAAGDADDSDRDGRDPSFAVLAPAAEFEPALDLASGLSEGRFDLGIRVHHFEPLVNAQGLEPVADFEILHRENSSRSTAARDLLQRRLQTVNEYYFGQRLRRLGSDDRSAVQMVFTPVAGDTLDGVSLAAIVPLILTLMTVTGAVYPAIDLTAGERERGTLEALIAAPVPRLGLLFAKYVAVLCVAILTATVNLIAMLVTIRSIQLGPLLFGEQGVSLTMMGLVFGLTVLFAAFFSAILLALTSFARSFKEAQAYLIPVMLLAFAPGLLSLIPGLRMNGLLAVAPLMNCVILGRDLLSGTANPWIAATVVTTTLLYAVVALAVAARIFGTDAVLYASRGTWSDLFVRPVAISNAANPTIAFACLGIIFPGSILLRNAIGGLTDLTLELRMLASSGLSIGLFVMVPMLIAVWQRVDLQRGFTIGRPGSRSITAAVLLGLSLWPFVFELVQGVTSIDVERLRGLGLLNDIRQLPLAGKLLALAVIPAVTEEFFFRGFLLSALNSTLSARRSILLSAVVFGLFHVIVSDTLLIERLVPSTLMGVVLGWVCLRTGSIAPGMVLHSIHNGVFMTIVHFRPELEELLPGWQDSSHLPPWLLILSAVTITVACLLLRVPATPSTRDIANHHDS